MELVETIINSHLTFRKEVTHNGKQNMVRHKIFLRTNTHHLLSDGVVCCLKVAEHLGYNLLGIAAITHGIQQISCPLSNTHIPLSLQRQRDKQLQNESEKM